MASEPRDRSAPTKRRARERVGESEGRSPSDKTSTGRGPADRAGGWRPVAARGSAEGSSEQVVAFVRRLIERGRWRPGDRLPAERALATRIGVSRPTVRAGLHSLAALGVVHSKP